ncbi:MAG: radical SAM protein [gamma proteobacterium symbiont of Taylorina sp.]|nr:radical SAM protein [gamma proteobacterium symbiont of Taylorina sp.]
MKSKYSKLKIFHYKDKLDSLSKETNKILPPIHIRIKPTNICNHNCWYCAYHQDDFQLGQDMVMKDSIPEEKMMEIIDDIADMGVKAVTFSGGGEPLYYRHIDKALQKLADHKIAFASLTNGSFLKETTAELFAKYGTWLRISIDGWDDASYKKYRNCKEGEYTKVIENIKKFKQRKSKCVLGISFILDKDNVQHIEKQMNLFKSIGVDNVKLSAVIVSNDSKENNRYHAPIFKQTKDTIKKIKNELEDENFEIFDAYHELDENFSKDYDWCPHTQIKPVIGADQNIYTCQDKAYNLDTGVLGSIKDQSFKKFWYSDKKNFFKVKPSRDCNHHCVVNTHNKLVLEYCDIDKQHLDFV